MLPLLLRDRGEEGDDDAVGAAMEARAAMRGGEGCEVTTSSS